MVALAVLNEPTIDDATMIPDLLARHPQARTVLDHYGLRGCGGRLGPDESLGFFAATHGVEIDLLLSDLREALHHVDRHVASNKTKPEDSIYRRFFLGAIATVLTAGASWGAIILWQIGFQGKFTGIPVQHVNAHGQAQIYGWCALFIMGFAYQAFPRMWQAQLVRPKLAGATFILMLAGLTLRTIGMIGSGSWAIPVALVGGAAQIAAVTIFAAQIFLTFQRSSARVEPYIGFILIALLWFFAMTVLDQWHTYRTMSATSRDALVAQIATWQAPLRDLQIHGLLMFTIFGVSMRMLPPLFGVPSVNPRRAWRALILLTLAVTTEVMIFLIYRLTMNHAVAALLMIPWITLTIGAWMVAAPFKLWRKPSVADRSVKFVRAAYAWLAISLVMLLLLPVHQALSHIPFSHAYYGSIRHAITVGFASLMIMGMAAKVVPTLNGVDPRRLPSLWLPFALVNLGCFLRVSLQALTDFYPQMFSIVGISGVFEVAGLTIWGVGLARIMLKRPTETLQTRASKRDTIAANDIVGDVLATFPRTLDAFTEFGFAPLRNPFLRKTLARTVTIHQAARMHGVDVDELLVALNQRKLDALPAID
ncbi:MAG TPA: DUF1858 domain-containing protein [Tepidisphaeraceae bacterium]|jgi:hypothetical protein|nr:DUF1858 domain-containing protein [Tepidisphaeraceae bacterium]